MHFKFMTLFVRDLNKSIDFYTGLAGLTVTSRFKPGNLEIAFLADAEGATEIELIQPPAGAPLYEGRGIVICFETNDVESTRKAVIDAGLDPTDIGSHDNGSRFFHVNDPNGMSVEFMQT